MPGNTSSSFSVKALLVTLLMIVPAIGLLLLLQALIGLSSGAWSPGTVVDTLWRWLLGFWLPWVVLAPLLACCLQRFGSFKPEQLLRAYLPCLLLLLLLHTGLLLGLVSLGIHPQSDVAPEQDALLQTLYLLRQNAWWLLDGLVFMAWSGLVAYRGLQQQLREQEQTAFALNRHLTDSRLQSLKMQLNPHFLFNTLNGLAVLIDKEENIRARDMLDELSKFLRQTLRGHGSKWTSLEQELEFIRQYLRIEQYRFGERLTWFEDCEPLALTAKVPPMLLQPLFENAIVHGLADKQGECRLGFECRLYDRYLLITIFDNGDKFDTASDPLDKAGIGLSNVQTRLREVYGEHFALKIEKKTDGTLVTLKLPSYKDSQF